MANKLLYNVEDKPSWGKTILFAFQQVLAILAATIAVPAIINSNQAIIDALGPDVVNMSPSAALFGAGIGTLIYLICTKFKSPVFLGSSFAFIPSMIAAFTGASSNVLFGYLGLVIGAIFMGLVYLGLSLIVKFVGTNWIDKVMPPVIIGPTVALIGLSLAGNAVSDFTSGGFASTNSWIAMLIGFITLVVIIVCSLYGNKFIKIIPFIIGIAAGYAIASIFTGIGYATGNDALKVVDWSSFNHIEWAPNFAIFKAAQSFTEMTAPQFWTIVGGAALGYIPVAFVIFAEHIADHKNLSSIIDRDLLKEPGLKRTLMGDALGSMVGASCGGCPITTYGESVGCVAISGNASVRTIIVSSILCMVLAFIGPFATALATIPKCVMGGVCISLYGFIAVSGFKMIQKVNLDDKSNIFVVSIILIVGIGGLVFDFGSVKITSIAAALIIGIIINVICGPYRKKHAIENQEELKEEKEANK